MLCLPVQVTLLCEARRIAVTDQINKLTSCTRAAVAFSPTTAICYIVRQQVALSLLQTKCETRLHVETLAFQAAVTS